jgi:hypothetical protein
MGSRRNLVDFVSRARTKYSNIGPMTSVNRDSFRVGKGESRIACLSFVGLRSVRDILVNEQRENYARLPPVTRLTPRAIARGNNATAPRLQNDDPQEL